MKYRHKFLIEGGPSEESEKRLPNVFHWYGEREIDGESYVGLVQEGSYEPAPTWFRVPTFEGMFEKIP